jgi:plastocyanin
LRRSALTLALCSLLVAGCGGDDEQPGRTVTAPANAKLRVLADEYSFDPSGIVLQGAGTLTVTLRNKGSLAHNLKVFRGDEEIGGTPTLPGGGSDSSRLNLEHGSYRMVCTVGDHEALGMTGTLRVR